MFRRAAPLRWMSVTVAIIMLTISPAPGSAAPPPPPPPNPPEYPSTDVILAVYSEVDPEEYFIPGNYGVFFLSPTGLNCGIWLKGSFGCSGFLPGAPPGINRIGWFNGEPRVHYDWTAAIQFPNIQATRVLPKRSYLNWNETTCVTTADDSTYCKRGEFRFYITPAGTWLNG